MNGHRGRLLAIVVLLATAGCSSTGDVTPPLTLSSSPLPAPGLDGALVQSGEVVYASTCAACHGVDLAGARDWKDLNDDGTWRSPPMDSSGHTWHHSDALLTTIITNGSDDSTSAMVGWGSVLSATEIGAVLEYLKVHKDGKSPNERPKPGTLPHCINAKWPERT